MPKIQNNHIGPQAPGTTVQIDGAVWGLPLPAGLIPAVADVQARKTQYGVPTLDTILMVLANGGMSRFNESSVWEVVADAPVSHITPAMFRHKAWGSTYADGTTHLLTAAEIAAHPEWIGNYIAGVNTRADVLLVEAFYAAYASKGVKARGQIATVTDNGGGTAAQSVTYTLQFDGDAWSSIIAYSVGAIVAAGGTYYQCLVANTNQSPPNATYWSVYSTTSPLDASVGLVNSLPTLGNGLYNEGVRGAMFVGVTGSSNPWILHMVQNNTATTVTTIENTAPPTAAGGDYRLAAGDRFELVQFNGAGNAYANKRIELLGGKYAMTRAICLQFSVGGQVSGCGQFATQLVMTVKDTPHLVGNGAEFFQFEHGQTTVGLVGTCSSTRPQFDMDTTGFVTGNGSAAAANQSNKWVNWQFSGTLGSGWDARLGTSGAPIALTAVAGQSATLTTPRALKLNELANAWLVIDTCPSDSANGFRRVGFRFRIVSHNAVGAGGSVTFAIDFPFVTNAPVAGGTPDTVHIEIASHCGIEWGAGRIYNSGSSGPQGSENAVDNFFAGSFSTAAFCSTTGNALQQSYKHGDIATCPNWGIHHFWGNALIESVGFQAGSQANANQWTFLRGNPSVYGFDIYLGNAVFESSRIHDCRSEGSRLLCNAGAQYCSITDSGVSGQFFGFPWSAGQVVNAASASSSLLPTMVFSSTNAHNDGTLWLAATINSGAKSTTTTSATEPVWDLVGSPIAGYGFRQVNEASAGGGADTILWMEADMFVSWLHGFSNQRFNVINGSNITMDNIRFSYGKIQLLGNTVGRLSTNRKDWYSVQSNDWNTPITPNGQVTKFKGPVIVNQPNGVTTWGFYGGASGTFAFDFFPFADRVVGIEPMLWSVAASDSSGIKYEVGWIPGARNTAVLSPLGRKSSDSHYGNGIIAPLAPRIIKDASGNPAHDLRTTTGINDRGTSGLTDIAGLSLLLGTGLGTGAGVVATIDFFTAAPGATGTAEQVYDAILAARIDRSTTAGDTRFLLYDVTKGALSRVTVGANDSGGTGFKVLRVPN